MATGTAISLTIGAALSAGWTQAFSQASKSVASFSEKAIANFGAAQRAEKLAAAELNKRTILIGNKQPTQAQASALETLNKQLERAKKRLADATDGVSAWINVSAAARKVRFSEAVQAASNSFSVLTQKIGSASTLLSTLFFDTAAKTAQGIDEMNRTAESLGISVETLQRFQFAGARAGISAEKLSAHLTEMSKRIAEAAAGTGEAGKVLESLNLSASALNKFDAATKFEILAKAIGDIKNESEQIRITDKLFGGEAIKTLPAMFRQGWAQIADDMNEANDHILKNANAETLAHDYVAAIERVSFSFNVLKQEAVVSLMPLLGKVLDGNSAVVSKLTWLAPAIASITAALIAFKGITLAVAGAIALKNAVLVASSAVINAWALACKAASVIAGIFNSVLNVLRAGTLAHVAAMGIAKTATLAWSAVTKAAAAAQWLLNVALTANPIGLVIAAIGALVAAIVWCWKNCDTFRTGVLAVFDAVTKGARWAFEGVEIDAKTLTAATFTVDRSKQFKSVKAKFHDADAKTYYATAGTGTPAKELDKEFSSEAEAQAAAETELAKLKRAAKTVSFSGEANLNVSADRLVKITGTGLTPELEAGEFQVGKVSFTLSAAGLQMSVSEPSR